MVISRKSQLSRRSGKKSRLGENRLRVNAMLLIQFRPSKFFSLGRSIICVLEPRIEFAAQRQKDTRNRDGSRDLLSLYCSSGLSDWFSFRVNAALEESPCLRTRRHSEQRTLEFARSFTFPSFPSPTFFYYSFNLTFSYSLLVSVGRANSASHWRWRTIRVPSSIKALATANSNSFKS